MIPNNTTPPNKDSSYIVNMPAPKEPKLQDILNDLYTGVEEKAKKDKLEEEREAADRSKNGQTSQT
jgi:hypothetical protein